MIITHGRGEGRASVKASGTFTGDVWSDPVLLSEDGAKINTVTFTPGARTFWHHHEHGQVLHVIGGEGLICTEGQSPKKLNVGDIIWIPAGERHWHGASSSSIMTHIAISLGETVWSTEVKPEEFNAQLEENNNHAK